MCYSCFSIRIKPLITIIIICLIGLVCAGPNRNKTCYCWWGYVEHSKPDPHCRNTMTDHVMPCNFPKTPTCKCTGNVSNILKDRTGTWCTRYSKGEELMRWPCENRDDWVKFFELYPELLV